MRNARISRIVRTARNVRNVRNARMTRNACFACLRVLRVLDVMRAMSVMRVLRAMCAMRVVRVLRVLRVLRVMDVMRKRLASLISEKHNQLCSTTLNWMRCRLSFSLIRSAIMCLRGTRSIYHRPIFSGDTMDVACSEGHISTQD